MKFLKSHQENVEQATSKSQPSCYQLAQGYPVNYVQRGHQTPTRVMTTRQFDEQTINSKHCHKQTESLVMLVQTSKTMLTILYTLIAILLVSCGSSNCQQLQQISSKYSTFISFVWLCLLSIFQFDSTL